MKSDELKAIYQKYTLNCYGRSSGVALAEGKGCEAWDLEGKRYLDFTSGVGVNNLGHCHPAVVAAVAEQAAKLMHTSNQFYHEGYGRLAEKLCRLSGLNRVFFSNSGAEANEAALKIARKWGREHGGGRGEIIFFENGFHGRTLGTISATGKPRVREGFGPFLEGFKGVPPFDLEAIKRAAGSKTAAVILEPIIGAAGVMLPPKGFFRELRDLADSVGFLIILDEMQTGMGRTGEMFAFEHEEIQPDILTLAKALGGGLPLGAAVCSEKTAAVITPGTHGTTFGGNPVAVRAALASLEILCEAGFLEQVCEMGAVLRAGLEGLSYKFPDLLKEVRSRGLMTGIITGTDPEKLLFALAQGGLLAVPSGSDSLRIYPPLIVSKSEIEEGLEIMERVFGGI